MKIRSLLVTLLAISVSTPLLAKPEKGGDGLKDAVVLIIRHAEKPETGFELAPAGVERANKYPGYFKNFTVDETPLKLDALFATEDSKGSHRPRLTIEPLAHSLGMTIDTQFKADECEQIAAELRTKRHGSAILICWHHGEIPKLVQALGADPAQVIPGSTWPGEVFGWVIQLRYDKEGNLKDATRINENLMPDDAGR
jgi:hypothetical protein